MPWLRVSRWASSANFGKNAAMLTRCQAILQYQRVVALMIDVGADD